MCLFGTAGDQVRSRVAVGGKPSIMAPGLTALRQGEVPRYTELLEDSRRHAIDCMIGNVRLLGANPVIAMTACPPRVAYLAPQRWSSARPGRRACASASACTGRSCSCRICRRM